MNASLPPGASGPGPARGARNKLSADQRRAARRMYDKWELTVEQIGRILGVSRTSIYRVLAADQPPTVPCAPEGVGKAPPAERNKPKAARPAPSGPRRGASGERAG